MLVGFFWYGINTYNGALCVDAVIVAIWPSFKDVPNSLPASANITTQMMTAYVVYFLIVLPFHYIHPRYLKWFFDAKTIICLPGIFALLGWACNISGGGLHTELMERKTSLSGSTYSWAFLAGVNAMIGNYGTMAVNINDFARYARSTRKIYGQLLVIPLSFMLISFMGIIIAGAASDHYGESIWDPLTIMRRWDGSSGARAASAFVSLSFVLAQLGSNISANCVSAANDLNAMFPTVCGQARSIITLLTLCTVRQFASRLVYHRYHWCMGSYAMEYSRVSICFVELHGWLHYLGTSTKLLSRNSTTDFHSLPRSPESCSPTTTLFSTGPMMSKSCTYRKVVTDTTSMARTGVLLLPGYLDAFRSFPGLPELYVPSKLVRTSKIADTDHR